MKRPGIELKSLPAQMVLTFIGLVLLTAAAAGLPALWLIRTQLQRQAWAQVEQGSRAAQALYAASQSELANLATLTAQRPTLRELLLQGERESLLAYLRTLQAGAGFDLLLICAADGRPVAQAGHPVRDGLCAASDIRSAGIFVDSAAAPTGAWLYASQSTPIEAAGAPVRVVVAAELADQFATQMRIQTGLEHTLLANGQVLASSLPGYPAARQPVRTVISADPPQEAITLSGRPYYASRFPLSLPALEASGRERGLEAEVALAVGDLAATQRSLAWTLVGSILAVAVVGSVLGAFLARQIARPLARLTEAASSLSRGDLDSSVAIEARVREVDLVAQALERARIDLRRTLTELREEKAWTDHLLEAIVEGIVTLDKNGRITFFSQGAERITGWSREAVLNRSCDAVFRTVETDQPFSYFIPPPGRRRKVTVELAHGHLATLAVTGARLMPPERGDARVALVFRDISEEEAVHRLMSHFLANVAHEFRTPLSALAASVELLLDQAPDLTAAELQELLTSLHLGIVALQTLVDNLLESASIEAGRFRVYPRPANVSQIITEASRTMKPLLNKRGQRLVLDLPAALPLVRADPRRTVQVLVNLLSNASRYGPDEAEITISADLSEGWVQVNVADRGPGIPPQYRDDLFRRFVYPDSPDGASQFGAGLGLSVVKAIVEAHGGQAGVEDRPDGGSIFWFTLPVEGGS